MTGLDPIPDATEHEIRGVLNKIPASDDVIVYDVGQGNCNGLRSSCIVSLYFDFGGGTQANLTTYPTNLAFCFTQQPPVILSHWDWDHWASGARHQNATYSKWIVPRQRLGATHAQFASRLLSKGNLLIWPDALPHLSFAFGKVQKCNGSGRNDSGLAVLVDTQLGTRSALLPGDARYSVIPDNGDGNLDCLVMTHHGGKAHESFVPAPANPTTSKLICSVGNGNHWQHPLGPTMTNHASAGWGGPVRTDNHLGMRRGHVSAQSPHNPLVACGSNHCTLAPSK